MLLVNEIYPAICGESRFIGRPCTLVRLTGCHIRCLWCDSEHSFAGGRSLATRDIVEEVRGHGFATVLVTGGEPLLQAEVVDLMRSLLDDGRAVLLETSGTLGHEKLVPLREVPDGVHRIVALKARPGRADEKTAQEIRDLASDEIKKDFDEVRDDINRISDEIAGVRAGLASIRSSVPGGVRSVIGLANSVRRGLDDSD